MPGHHQKGGRLQRVATADQVEGVLDIVRSGTNQSSAPTQRTDRRQTTRGGRRMVPTLEEQVGLRQGHHAHAGIGH